MERQAVLVVIGNLGLPIRVERYTRMHDRLLYTISHLRMSCWKSTATSHTKSACTRCVRRIVDSSGEKALRSDVVLNQPYNAIEPRMNTPSENGYCSSLASVEQPA